MCDYSLQNVKSRAAKVGDRLTTRNFGPRITMLWNFRMVLLTFLCEEQQATVLQLPAEPKTPRELENQKHAAYVG